MAPDENFDDDAPASDEDMAKIGVDSFDLEWQQRRLLNKMFGVGDGTRLAQYEILEELGRGGMGVVYAAYDHTLERKVAIKRVHGEGDAVQRHRLAREAKAMARLAHPNVVPVFEIREVEDRAFIVMEFVDGLTLSEWLRAEQRSWRAILDIFIEAGEGLSAAHQQGLVHGDFKPGNVMVGRDGRARVMDFGLARLDPSCEVTSLPSSEGELYERQIAGTPKYMAPEQFRGHWIDALSDQFSFCVALYEALHGCSPFPGTTLKQRWLAAKRGRLRQTPKFEFPVRVQDAINRGLTADSRRRFASMRELLTALGPGGAARTLLSEPGDSNRTLPTIGVSKDDAYTDLFDPTVTSGTHGAGREDLVPRWRLLERIGSGAMGVVWLAERADGAFHMRAAVKLLKSKFNSPDIVTRSVRERQLLADLDHPNICRLLDGGTALDGRPYSVMEFVDGERIDHYCRNRACSKPVVVDLVIQLCEALAVVHAQGIVHRDIKPSNILVTQSGRPKLVDFGIACVIDSDDRNTLEGQWVMTPAYASPEQWRGLDARATSDIYSLAVVLVELLTGWRTPRAGTREPELPSEVEQRLGDSLHVVVARALRHDPAQRFSSASDFAAALRHCLTTDFEREPASEESVGRIEDRGSGARSYLTARYIIGRSTQCQLCLRASNVSGVHAEIVWTGSGWTVRDLGSRNGTFLGGQKLSAGERASLSRGAELWFGDRTNCFWVVDDAPPKLMAVGSNGQARIAEDELLCLPSIDDAEVMIFPDGDDRWLAESVDGTRDLGDNETILVGGEAWSVHLPTVQAHTHPSTPRTTLSSTGLELELFVSEDGKLLKLRLVCDESSVELEAGTHATLLLPLAQQRLADAQRSALPVIEQGWMSRHELAGALDIDALALNGWVYRLRRELIKTGIRDVGKIISRRMLNDEFRLKVARVTLS